MTTAVVNLEDIMYEIEFEYCDEMSKGEWRKQSCVMSSVQECKKVYGLGVDCDYRILSVKKIER
jgi:hypothetical protein